MKILEYNDVNPVSVLNLSLLALDFALTPELAANIRRNDPRPFPCFSIHAVEGDEVLGQVGILRLPMISTEGREDVGGVWAVSTHPKHAGSGIESLLLDEAHNRMREAGLRFSTLGTDRYRVDYKLYQRHGYEDTNVLATALASWGTAHQPTRLSARPPSPEGFDFVDEIFEKVANPYLGFAWRHSPFAPLRDKVNPEDVWILWDNKNPVGYALVHSDKGILNIRSLSLSEDIDIREAIAAVVTNLKTPFIIVNINRPIDIDRLRRSGYLVTHPNWNAFMVKPLTPEVNIDDAYQLFGIGTDRFLISRLDIT